MAIIHQLTNTLRSALKSQATLLARPFGLELLTKDQTETYLRPSEIAFKKGELVTLPEVNDFTDASRPIFGKTDVTSANTLVWQCANQRNMRQLRNGSVVANNRVLDTDFGGSALFKDLLKSDKRAVLETDTLLAPWSHYWGGYYDYLFFVAAKLCRMKETLPAETFANAIVSYPLMHTPFERELLIRIGLKESQIIDSRTTNVHFKTCILGNNDSWFYPNIADVAAIQKHVSSHSIMAGFATSERIYISRSGRRRVLNEDALVRMLEQYGFVFIEDKSRSIEEQYALYRQASFIIGPHGASFANVLWCQPGTQLLEFFAPDYVPDYFRHVAHILGLRYTAHCSGAVRGSNHRHVNDDIRVDVDLLEKQVAQRLETSIT
ncbi:hypothetical protein GCM10027592_32190 [Spirosoma flavus]